MLFGKLAAADLPAGFGFDKFGLIVRKERQQLGGIPEGVPEGDAGAERPRKRQSPPDDNQPQRKRARATIRLERSDEEQTEDLASILRSLDDEFAENDRLSREHAWCAPIPHDRKVSTVEEFYKVFYDVRTMLIHTCMICYGKCAKAELEEIDWD